MSSQASAVHWDEATGEPYLAVPSHPGIRITPLRDSPDEVDSLVRVNSAPSVGRWFFSRPFPYSPADGRKQLDAALLAQAPAIASLRSGAADESALAALTVVRDTQSGRYIGDVGVYPAAPESDLAPWGLLYTLDPQYHGQGLGTAVVGAYLAWLETLGVGRVEAVIQTTNVPSSRLVKRLGFSLHEVKGAKWPESKGGDVREVGVWLRDVGPRGTEGKEGTTA
ncbi:uncharacterized protein LOC62_06G008051 [Vanrija pseudolonga]|uniref:N-acetyltransferase domain-containing protein n=1 Tax=Vanrija pseudolonga TaxID=143232 RepID=A0AAF0YD67_9TREE|nr:hypothetical protein LOC62_06G008051 [Vanrija pseudolonga]